MAVTTAELRWIEAFIRGDERAFDALFELYADRVYRLAYRLIDSAPDAEDITSETFVRAFRSADRLREPRAFSTYLFRTAHRLAVDRLQQPKLIVVEMPEVAVAGRQRLDAQLTLHQALDRLPPDYRSALILVDIEGFTAEEAAAALNVTVSAFKARLHRARRVLKGILIDDNV